MVKSWSSLPKVFKYENEFTNSRFTVTKNFLKWHFSVENHCLPDHFACELIDIYKFLRLAAATIVLNRDESVEP